MQTNRGNQTKIELTYLSISLQVYLLTLMSWSVGCLRPSIMLCNVGTPTFNRPASSSISASDQKNEKYRSQWGTLANLEKIMGNHKQVSKDLRASCSRKLANAFHQTMLTSVGVKKPTITNRQSCHATAPKSKHAEVWQLLFFRSFYYIVQASLHRDIQVSMLYRNN